MSQLIEILLRGSFLSLAGICVFFSLRKQATKARSRCLTLTILALLALPIIVGFGLQWKVLPSAKVAVQTPAVSIPIKATREQPLRATLDGVPPTAISELKTPFEFPWRAFFLTLYSLGALASLVPVMRSWFNLRQLKLSAVRSTDLRIRSLAGVDSKRVYLSASTSMPMTWGFREPIILLPSDATTWSDARLRVVLAHERAHLERWDTGMTLLVQFTRALYWPQPLVWWLARQWQAEAELDCDRRVIEQGEDAHDYATALYDFAKAQSQGTPVALPMARTQPIEERVKRVLSPSTSIRRGATLPALIALSAFFALALVAQEEEAPPKPDPAMEELMATDKLLNDIILPRLKIDNATLEDAVSQLIELAKTHDERDLPEEDKGIRIVVAEDKIREFAPASLQTKITLDLQKVPLLEAIRYTSALADLKFIMEPNLVTILPKQSAPEGTLFTRRYFLGVPLEEDDAKEFLEARGVQFQEDAMAFYSREQQTLVVRNTEPELDQVNKIVLVHNSKALEDVIRQIVIPEFKLEQAPLREAVTKLSQATVTHDDRDLAATAKGIKFIVDDQGIGKRDPETLKTPISLDLRDQSASELLKFITQLAGVTYQVETFAVKIVPLLDNEKPKLGPGDVFLQGHIKLQQGRRHEDQRDFKAASACYAEAMKAYDSIARLWPVWEEEMLDNRRRKVRKDLARMRLLAADPQVAVEPAKKHLRLIDEGWSDEQENDAPVTPEAELQAREAEKRQWNAMKRHVEELGIPEFSIENVTLEEAIKKLMDLSVTNDKRDVPKNRLGVNILIAERRIRAANPEAITMPLKLTMSDTSVVKVLDAIMKLSGLNYQIEPFAVVIVPLPVVATPIVTKRSKPSYP